MKKESKHTEASALRSLQKKKDIRINGIHIQILKGKKASNDLGNGSWGKIDFLTNKLSYRKAFVNEFTF